MKINKLLSLTLGAILMVSLATGCSNSNETKTEKKPSTKQNIAKSPVLREDIEFVDKKILEQEIHQELDTETKFKNNSNKTIKGITVEYDINNGESVYLSTYDTIKPGETESSK